VGQAFLRLKDRTVSLTSRLCQFWSTQSLCTVSIMALHLSRTYYRFLTSSGIFLVDVKEKGWKHAA